jgi:hypothetical protein
MSMRYAVSIFNILGTTTQDIAWMTTRSCIDFLTFWEL